jgi:hypothetical protein
MKYRFGPLWQDVIKTGVNLTWPSGRFIMSVKNDSSIHYACNTWLMVLAEAEVIAVPAQQSRKVLASNIPGAMAYPAIAVTTTKPANINSKKLMLIIKILETYIGTEKLTNRIE